MKIAVNIEDLKNRLGEFLEKAEKGDEIDVCRQNIPFATIIGKPIRKNRSKPGRAIGTITVLGPLEGPIIPEADWNMLRDDEIPALR